MAQVRKAVWGQPADGTSLSTQDRLSDDGLLGKEPCRPRVALILQKVARNAYTYKS